MLVKKGKYADDETPPVFFTSFLEGVMVQLRPEGWVFLPNKPPQVRLQVGTIGDIKALIRGIRERGERI